MRFWSYSRASLRLWRKQWVGVLVAVVGLAVAFAVSILAGLYVYDGIRSDAWLEDADRIYRVNTQTVKVDGADIFGLGAQSFGSVAGYSQQQFPSIEVAVRLKEKDVNLEQGAVQRSSKWVFADASFSAVFPLDVLRGELALAFLDPGAVALSRSEAQAFGGLDSVGTIINVAIGENRFSEGTENVAYEDKFSAYKVVAVYQDLPPNTHLALAALSLYIPPETLKNFSLGGDLFTYLKFSQDTNIAGLMPRFTKIISESLPVVTSLGISSVASLEPVLGMQFNSVASGGFRTPVKSQYLWVLGLMGGILLLTAGFNFANVFTAINLLRGKEMALRRIVGAQRHYLGIIGLIEGIMISLLSFIFAVFIAIDLAPLLTELTGVTPQFLGAGRTLIWAWACGFACLVGVMAVAYPIFVMSRPQPIDLLRDGQNSVAGSKGRLKQMLVALQALAFVGTVLAAVQIFYQINHLTTRDQGYRFNDTVVLTAPKDQAVQFSSSFREDFAQLEGVYQIAVSGSRFMSGSLFIWAGKKDGDHAVSQMVATNLSKDLLEVLEIEPVAAVEGDWSQFSQPVAIAERDLVKFGFETPEEALGQIIERVQSKTNDDGTTENSIKSMRVVAVLPHFRGEPRYFGDAPYIYQLATLQPEKLKHLTAHVDLSRYRELLPEIEALWRSRFGDAPLNVFRYDEDIEDKYQNEARIGRAVLYVAVLTAILGFAGLYGMATHWLSARERELALRRVLGASRRSVMQLAMQKMLLPVGLGALAALLPTWYGVQQWAANFSDFASVGPMLYLAVVLLTLLLAGTLLLLQVRRALRRRPAHVLYHE